MESFPLTTNQPKNNPLENMPESKKDITPSIAQQYQERIENIGKRLLNKEFKEFSGPEDSIKEEVVRNLYQELQSLTNEIATSQETEINSRFQQDALRSIGEKEALLFDYLNPNSWPFHFDQEKRIIEEQKAKTFMQAAYFDQFEQFKNNPGIYNQKNVLQLPMLLRNLSYHLGRTINWEEQERVNPLRTHHLKTLYQESLPRIEKWLDGLEVQKIIDISLDLIDQERTDLINQRALREFCEQEKEVAVQRIIESVENFVLTDKKTGFLMILLTDIVGVEEGRKILNESIIKNQQDASIQRNLKYARSFITPNDDKEAILNLQNFYQENIKFKEYSLNNAMTGKEIELLRSLIKKDEKVLEHGCGAGRLIARLAEAGYDIEGFDFTPQHVKDTKEKLTEHNAKAEVFEADWHNLKKIPDEKYDVVYSLGRNILHDYSIADQVQLFREANRILKSGGNFIFDIPNRGKATPEELRKVIAEIKLGKSEEEVLAQYNGYEKMVLKYGIEIDKRSIHNFRFGTIYDSPDNINFATRYAYSHEDIEELARLAGFKIAKIEKRTLETGAEDENWYYVLEKA